ncbi:MAG: hypothetical protein IJU45_04380 [Clostridia bacterium]|nr:hypothetical protein [Clostridia bacterium]
MLGYVRAYKPDMTFRNYDIYKGIYCSLCKEIGKRYGLLARLTLSYDFVFFALVRMGLKESCVPFKNSRCSFNPAKKCLKCPLDNGDLQYTADVSMLMVYYKYLDNVDDSSFFKRLVLKVLSPYFKRIYKKAKKMCPEGDRILNEMYQHQKNVEQSDVSLDAAAHPSAEALGSLLTLNSGYEDEETLYRFGYAVGRWVYLADAADDYEDDLKSGSFNPFSSYGAAEAAQKARYSLNMTLGEAVSLFEKLKINHYKNIIHNIVYDGMYCSAKKIFEKKGEKQNA